jgi:hypothetical protein
LRAHCRGRLQATTRRATVTHCATGMRTLLESFTSLTQNFFSLLSKQLSLRMQMGQTAGDSLTTPGWELR